MYSVYYINLKEQKLTLNCHVKVEAGWLSALHEKLAVPPITTEIFCGVFVKMGGAEIKKKHSGRGSFLS